MSWVAQVKEKLQDKLVLALEAAKAAGEISYQELPGFIIETPKDKNHGDFATNLAILLAKQAQQNPRQIAQIICNNFNKENSWVENTEVAGPGFINFYLKPGWLSPGLRELLQKGSSFGDSLVGAGKKIQVEFVSANPTGELHMGNARGAAIGDTLANILAAAGYTVEREFYINDAGNQIEKFGLSLEARYLQLLGEDAPFPEDGYHGGDITQTMQQVINISGDKYKNMESALRREYLTCYALEQKISAAKTVLAEFGVEYDVWFSEQTLHDSGAVSAIITELLEAGKAYEENGTIWFKATDFGIEKDEVLVRANGIPTYYAADIAYHKNKFKRGFDKVINIWGADHHGHVARLKAGIQAVGYEPERLQVILMQLVRLLSDGEVLRMSKRAGTYVTLQELIKEVGVDAARFFFVMRNADSQMDFDLDLAKSQSVDNPVFYVQYAHARISSIIETAKAEGQAKGASAEANLDLLLEPVEMNLIRKLLDLPDEIAYAAATTSPHHIITYVMDLASFFHSFYNSCRVLGEDPELMAARLALCKATAICTAKCLKIVGVSAPTKM